MTSSKATGGRYSHPSQEEPIGAIIQTRTLNVHTNSYQLITYIPNYKDIFNDGDTKVQVFIANIFMENLKKKKEIEGKK